MKLLTIAALAVAAVEASGSLNCPESCTDVYYPMCGSNGVTYDNMCKFEIAKCHSDDPDLTIVYTRECPDSFSGSGGSASASSNSSDGHESSTSRDLASSVSCEEEFACLDVYDPVCGSDGVTYSNSCQLKRAQCTDPSIQQVSTGECSSAAGSASVGGDADNGGIIVGDSSSGSSSLRSASSSGDVGSSASSSSSDSSSASASRSGAVGLILALLATALSS